MSVARWADGSDSSKFGRYRRTVSSVRHKARDPSIPIPRLRERCAHARGGAFVCVYVCVYACVRERVVRTYVHAHACVRASVVWSACEFAEEGTDYVRYFADRIMGFPRSGIKTASLFLGSSVFKLEALWHSQDFALACQRLRIDLPSISFAILPVASQQSYY